LSMDSATLGGQAAGSSPEAGAAMRFWSCPKALVQLVPWWPLGRVLTHAHVSKGGGAAHRTA
jgi:hypothetical protein